MITSQRTVAKHNPGVTRTSAMRRYSRLLSAAVVAGTLLLAPEAAWTHQRPDVVWSLPNAALAYSIAFSPDGQLIAVGRSNGETTLHRIADAATVLVLPDDAPARYGRGNVGCLAFSPDGSLLATSAGYAPEPVGHMARIWRVTDGLLLWDFSNQVPAHIPHTLAFSRTGSFLFWGADAIQSGPSSWDYRTLGLLNPTTGLTYQFVQTPGTDVTGAALSRDNSRIAAAAVSGNGVWRILLFTLPDMSPSEIVGAYNHPYPFASVEFSPDGATLASCPYYAGWTSSEDTTVRLWNVADGSASRALDGLGVGVSRMAFSPDGATLAASGGRITGGGGAIGFWRLSDGQLLQRWNDPQDVGGGVLALAISPDGAYIAYTRSSDGAVVLARHPYGPPPGSSVTVSSAGSRIGDTVTLSALLASGGAGVGGKTVAFSVGGSGIGDAITDASGWARTPYVVPEADGVGDRPVTASFAGDANLAPASGSAMLTVLRTDTKLFLLDRFGPIGETCLLKGYLYRGTDRGWIAGRPIDFAVDSVGVGSATTDAEGRAVLPYVIPEGAGPGLRSITSAWAGDPTYGPSAFSSVLAAVKGSLYIWVLQPRIAPVGGGVYLRAYVRTWPQLAWKAGTTIAFSVDGTEVGSDTTNADGRASVLYTIPGEMTPGDHTLTCAFAGDASYEPASGGGILTVVP